MLRCELLTSYLGAQESPEIVDDVDADSSAFQRFERRSISPAGVGGQPVLGKVESLRERRRPVRRKLCPAFLNQNERTKPSEGLGLSLGPEWIFQRQGEHRAPTEPMYEVPDTSFKLDWTDTHIGKGALRRDPERPVSILEHRFTDQQKAAVTPERPEAVPGENIDLPPLGESVALVRQLVGQLSSHPKVAAWLTADRARAPTPQCRPVLPPRVMTIR